MVREASGVVLIVLAVLFGLSAGCRSINKGITETVLARKKPHEWRIHYASRVQYALTDETLLDVEFEGSRNAGNTVVRYQSGLADQAQCLADRTAALLKAVHERTGVTITTRSTIYLLRFDRQPQDFTISLTADPNEFVLPLFMEVGQDSCDAIVAQSRSYPYLLVHELVETSLVSRVGGSVLPDLAWGTPSIKMYIKNYTRWFRDGFANYAGYIAYETTAGQICSEKRLYQQETLLHAEPFSSLALIGDNLFSWPQSSEPKLERVYYNAALGLFLLIADTYGEQAIRDIVHEITQRRAVDGRDLIEITNRALHGDVKQLARDFKFPLIGAQVELMTPALALNRRVEPHAGLFVEAIQAGSLARRGGLRTKDVITAVGDAPVANHLDFEVGLFERRTEKTVPVTVQRRRVGPVTLDLPLR